jgi:UDP-N-acetylglucosamine 2-epimerase (non-hydrolysing)
MKVMTLVGTRPEIIKLSCVIPELDRATQHILVHTGQNYDYELNQIFFDGLGLRKPDHFLDAAGASAAQTIANVIAKSDEVMRAEKPDAFLLLGDTNSCLAVIAAKRLKIPIFHMEAGNRCFDERVPEEVNRRIVDHVSDINLVYSEHARRYLLAEGIRAETVLKTGSPMKQVLTRQAAAIDASQVLKKLGLERGKYFAVSSHREENVDDEGRFTELLGSLTALRSQYGLPVVVSTHPRTRKRLEALGSRAPSDIRFMPPLGFADYVQLQKSALCVLSDSGTLTEEASIVGFAGVMIREAHERPEGMDEGTVIMAGTRPERILEVVKVATERFARAGRTWRIAPDYDVDDVASKVVNAILGYTDYVNRTVWRRISHP